MKTLKANDLIFVYDVITHEIDQRTLDQVLHTRCVKTGIMRDAVSNVVWDEVYGGVCDAVRHAVCDELNRVVCDTVGDVVWNQNAEKNRETLFST